MSESKFFSTVRDKAAELTAAGFLGATAILYKNIPEKVVGDAISSIGPKTVLAALLVLASLTAYLLLKRVLKKKTVLERVVPVPGKGYCKDPKTGEALCPTCAANGHASYMMLTQKEHAFHCYACNTSVLK